MFLLLTIANALAGCPDPVHSFYGQPTCLSFSYEDGSAVVTNGCAFPALFDQSVLVGSDDRRPGGLLAVDETTSIRVSDGFTVGVAGGLFRVVPRPHVGPQLCDQPVEAPAFEPGGLPALALAAADSTTP